MNTGYSFYRPQTMFEARQYFHRCLSTPQGGVVQDVSGCVPHGICGRLPWTQSRHIPPEPEKRTVRILLECFLVGYVKTQVLLWKRKLFVVFCVSRKGEFPTVKKFFSWFVSWFVTGKTSVCLLNHACALAMKPACLSVASSEELQRFGVTETGPKNV